MSQEHEPTHEEMARQARLHLESLRLAGVDWLPNAPLPARPAPPPSPKPAVAATPIASAPVVSLFDAVDAERAPSLSIEERQRSLEIVATTVSKCTRCSELACTRTQTVFGVGRPGVELCFIGEAPGADEDAQGEPFVGAAGQLLNRIIAACGMKREDVYICNILKCRPPGNRLPLPNEAANCREYLEKQLELVQPKFICALGACAAQNLLGTTLSIGKLRGQFHSYRGIPVLCTYHPAYLLRSPDRKKDVWEDMKKLLTRMSKPIPRR